MENHETNNFEKECERYNKYMNACMYDNGKPCVCAALCKKENEQNHDLKTKS